MHPRASALGTRTVVDVEIEASISTDTDQDGNLFSVMQLRQTGRVVSTVKHEQWRGGAVKQRHHVLDLVIRGLVGRSLDRNASDIQRRGPTALSRPELSDPGERPSSDHRLPGAVPTGVVVKAASWAGLGIILDPSAGVDGKDWGCIRRQGLAHGRSQLLDMVFSMSQCGVQAAPAVQETALQAEVREARHHPGGRDRVQQVKLGVGTAFQRAIHVFPKLL